MLETLLKQIKDAEDRKKKLEEERNEATAQLHENQEKIKNFPKLSEVEMQKEMEKIQTLESKVRELAKKCDLESVLHEELSLEIQALQRAQAKASRNDPALQNPMTPNEMEPFLKSVGDLVVPACSACTIASTTTVVGTAAPTATASAVKDTAASVAMQHQSHPFAGEAVGVLPQASSSAAVPPAVSVPSQAPVQTAPLDSTSEIDRILARIEQDNRILAELENTRNIVGSSAPFQNVERSKLISEEVKKKEKEVSTAHNIKQSVTIVELEKLMEKLEQDNRILAELDKKRSAMDSHFVTSTSHHALSTNVSEDGSLHHGASSFATPSPSLGSLNVALSSHTPTSQARDSQRHPMPASTSAHTAGDGEEDEMADYIDFIELPGRGRCQIYCARYSYDPLKQSPNENPEAELCLNAGDYIIIFGEMDEDGFFNGELLDGRKGLVPSNFVEKLTGEELYEFQSIVLYGNRDSDDSSVCFSYSADYEVVSAEDFLLPDDFHRMNDYIDLEDFDEDDEEGLSDSEKKNDSIRKAVPPPQRLILERQLNKSFLIGWLPPEDRSDTIEAYHVYVDGIPKATIQSAERTRALIEGVDSSKPHRISVRSVSSSGYHSNDAACTIVVGKDVPLAPTCVKASHVTSTTAIVSWLPSNSNFQHVIAVNSVEVKVIKPGRFRHRISGLSPNTVYRVSIRVRPGKLFNNEEKNHKKLQMLVSNVEFKTLPKGLPDPPVNVQVEQGPQDGTLLVTWMPVVPNQSSLHISPVTGYIVFAAGKSVAEIDSPSGDHALVDACHLLVSNKKSITVRSKSEEGLSSESLPCVVSTDLLRSFQKSLILSSRNEERTPRERRSSSSDSESDTELAELLNHVNRRARAFDPVDLSTFADKGDLPEDLPFEERSELSDIVEEEEDITVDAGEGKQRNVGSSNFVISQIIDDSYGISREEDINSSHVDLNQQQISSGHSNVHSSPRRQYQTPSSSVISQRKQRWKEQSHTSRMRDDDGMVPRQERDMQNSPRKPAHSHNENRLENGIDSSQMNIPSIEITKDMAIEDCNELDAFSDEDYDYDSRKGEMSVLKDSSSPRRMHRKPQDVSHHMPDTIHGPHRDAQGRPFRRPPHKNNPSQIHPKKHYNASTQGPISQGYQQHNDHSVRMMADRERQRKNAPSVQAIGSNHSHSKTDPVSYVNRNLSSVHHSGVMGNSGHLHKTMGSYSEEMEYNRHTGHIDELEPNTGDNRVRVFVALFDYDPQTMSPNPDAADEELPFQEGQLIKIYGDKDIDGFYRGETNGQIGLVPGNMISEVQMDTLPNELMNDNSPGRPHTLRALPVCDRRSDCNWSSKQVRKMYGLYDYDPTEVSPNVDSEVELSFKRGDVVYVIGEVGDDGFFLGEVNGVKGLVPSNFLTDTPPASPLQDEESHSLAPLGMGHITRPKGQGWSHLGLSHNSQLSKRNAVSTKTPISAPATETIGLQRRYTAPCGMRRKENQCPEDHMYHQGLFESSMAEISFDQPPLISTGRRPTFLDLQLSPSASFSSFQPVEENRKKFFQELGVIHDCSMPKQSRRGIFSSFKDMFKPLKRN